MAGPKIIGRIGAASSKAGSSKRSFAIVVAAFFLISSAAVFGYSTWAGGEEEEKHIAEPAPGQGYVVLTFDDGSKSVYQHGYPIMAQAGIPGTVFVVTDAIGGSYEGRPCMNAAQLRALQDEGWEVGSHSKTHPDFSKLSPEQAEYEQKASKAALEAIGINGTTFAYPWGTGDNENVAAGAEIYERQRSGYGPMDSRGLFLPDYSPGIPVVGSVTPDSPEHAKALIDQAIATDSVIIFLLHDVTPTGNLATPIRETNLRDIVDYIVEKRESVGLRAVTVGDLPTVTTEMYVWDGEGADELASTKENWYKVEADGSVINDAPPVSQAHYIWNATSSKNSTWDLDAGDLTAYSFAIAQGYTGKVEQGPADISMGGGGFYQGGGTFAGNRDKAVYGSGPVTVVNGTCMNSTINRLPPDQRMEGEKPWWSRFELPGGLALSEAFSGDPLEHLDVQVADLLDPVVRQRGDVRLRALGLPGLGEPVVVPG